MAKITPATKSMRKRQSAPKVSGPVTRTKNAKVAKPTASATKAKNVSTDNIFGRHLPSARLRLPSTGNVSALEQIVLLTETIRSRDPLNRLVQNGFDTITLQFIINQHRAFPKYPLKGNSLGALLRNTMREWQPEWSFSNQKSGTYQDKKPAPENLTLANMQLNCQDLSAKNGNGEGVIDNVSFEALAVDVTRLPDGDDALDLTRCVLWSLHNPGSGLLYPRDFNWLTHQLGGPKLVQQANHDQQVFERWSEADRANKNLIVRTEDKLSKAEDAMKEAQTLATYSAAETAYTTAAAVLATRHTARSALVTRDDGHLTVHQHLIPRQPHAGPDQGTVAHYIAQSNHQPSAHLPVGTQRNSSHAEVSSPDVGLDLIAPGNFPLPHGAHPHPPGIDEATHSNNITTLTAQHPVNSLSSKTIYQALLESFFGNMEHYTGFEDSALEDFPLEDSDYAMAAAALRLYG